MRVFNFEMVNFALLDGDIPRRTCSYVDEFNNRNLFLIAWLKKGVDIAFFKFYHNCSDLIVKYTDVKKKRLI